MCKCVHCLQYYKLKPIIILNDTTETSRKMKLMLFQKNPQAADTSAHTFFDNLLFDSALPRGFPISICVFKNTSQLALWKFTHWLLQNEGWDFYFWLIGCFFLCGKELSVLVRVDFWIWVSMFSWQSCKNDSHYPFKKITHVLLILCWHSGNQCHIHISSRWLHTYYLGVFTSQLLPGQC